MRTATLTFFYLALSYAASGALAQSSIPDLASAIIQPPSASDSAAQPTPTSPTPAPTSSQQPEQPSSPTLSSSVSSSSRQSTSQTTPPAPSSSTKPISSSESSSSSTQETTSIKEATSSSSSAAPTTESTSSSSSAQSSSSSSSSAPASVSSSSSVTSAAASKTSADAKPNAYFTSRASLNTDVATETADVYHQPTASAAGAASKGFFANKPAVAGTFLAVGVAAILAVWMGAKWIRRRRQDRRWAEEDDFLASEKSQDVEYGATGATPRSGGVVGSGAPGSPIDRSVDHDDAVMMSQSDVANVMLAAPSDAYPSRDIHYGQDAYGGQGYYAQPAAYGAYQPEYPPGTQPGAYGQQQYAYDGQYAADGQQHHGAYDGPDMNQMRQQQHPYGAAGVSYGMAQ